MNADFQTALRLLAKHEGGWSDRDKDADPGGKTMYGITQSTYNDWCDQKGKPRGEVRNIAYTEAAAIYRANYANPVRYEDLPPGIGYAVFDLAVNAGVSRAVRLLQEVLGVKADGIVGSQTLAAVRAANLPELIKRYCAARRKWQLRLKNAKKNPGWVTRINDVERDALRMAGEADKARRPGQSVNDARRAAVAARGDVIAEPPLDHVPDDGRGAKAYGRARAPASEYVAPATGAAALIGAAADTAASAGDLHDNLARFLPPWLWFVVLAGVISYLCWRVWRARAD